MSSSIIDSVLSAMVSSYEKNEIIVQVSRKTSKPRAKLSRVEKDPTSHGTVRKVATTTIPVPPKGSINAAGFMMALREAGKIRKENEAGRMLTLTDTAKEKKDQIQAIAAFVGYNFSASHGSQLDSARRTASFQLRPVKTDSAVTVIVKGFVAGMPNGTERAIGDLNARIKLATDTMLDAEKAAEAFEKDTAEHATHMALAAVESERIAHMRRDLHQITG